MQKLQDIIISLEFWELMMEEGENLRSPMSKIALVKINNLKNIEVWGDGNQTRSYLYIDDCVNATLQFSDYMGPINIGSEEQVSINQMIEMIENIANYKVEKCYDLNKPIGVIGRSSNNAKIKREIDWEPSFSLIEGLEKTYSWIYDMILKIKTQKTFLFC